MTNTVTVALTMDEFHTIMLSRSRDLIAQIGAAASAGDSAAGWKGMVDALSGLGTQAASIASAVQVTAAAAAGS
jgi:hypothetical protein